MNKRSVHIVLLLVIFLLAFILRFYKLGVVPDGLQQDETSIGYNAYSILKTGRDEHGMFLPQNFQAFGEYKLPGYIYATVLPVALFGLNAFSIRLVSAVAGFLTVIVAFFLTKSLLPYLMKEKGRSLALEYLPYGAALLFAINPWHLLFSRAAFEVTLADFFIVTGVWFFLKALERSNRLLFFFSAIFFAKAVYTYNIARLFVPFLILSLLWIFRKEVFVKSNNKALFFLVCFLIFLIPFLLGAISHGGADSTLGTFIFSSAKVQSQLLEFRSYFVDLPAGLDKLFFNSVLLTLWQYLQNIIATFSVSFFFSTGSGNGIDSIGTSGMWYLFELPFIFIGFFSLWKEKSEGMKLLVFWIVGVILISALTREPPQATRTFFLTYPVTVFSSVGLLYLVSYIRRQGRYMRPVLGGGAMLICGYMVSLYFFSYYIRYPIIAAKNYRTGDREASAYLRQHEQQYGHILIDKKAGFIYSSLLTYLPYDPAAFQHDAIWQRPDSEGFTYPTSFGKYEIREIDWSKDQLLPNTLILTTPNNKPNEFSATETIYYPLRPVVINVGQQIMQYPVQDIAYEFIDTGALPGAKK